MEHLAAAWAFAWWAEPAVGLLTTLGATLVVVESWFTAVGFLQRHPDPSPATQYTASSFAQPIRRVYGTLVFRAREIGSMPPPGSTAPANINPKSPSTTP